MGARDEAEREIAEIFAEADRLGARPVTTAKDHVRLPDDARRGVAVVEIAAVFEEMAALDAMLWLMLSQRGLRRPA